MQEFKDILEQCTIENNILYMPEQLDRKVYLKFSKALELIGGKWSRKDKGIKFLIDPTEKLQMLLNGDKPENLKKKYQFFATPKKVVELMVSKITNSDPTLDYLEPSAGQGAIIEVLNEYDIIPDICEAMPENYAVLKDTTLNYNFLGNDFLRISKHKKYDYIIANPPFSKNQDIDHIMQMYDLLKPWGTLITLSSCSWFHGSQKKQIAFKEFLHDNHAIIDSVEAGEFKESGTMIETKMIQLTREPEGDEPTPPPPRDENTKKTLF